MHNLIESGIEVVWFSDMTQNDVVYGICCQREEKKVTATLFGFYVAAKPRFSNIDRVYIWTYAAPRVGTEGMNVCFIYFIAIYRSV